MKVASPGGEPPAARSGPASNAWIGSLVLLALVALFCAGTRWGRNYPVMIRKTRAVWSGRSLPEEARKLAGYDETYPVLLYVRDNTPPDAVILLPPIRFVIDRAGRSKDDIPLLASASAAYNVLYPRVPVSWGEPSPSKDKIGYILVWEHWGLDLVQPGAPPTEENRIALFPWHGGETP